LDALIFLKLLEDELSRAAACARDEDPHTHTRRGEQRDPQHPEHFAQERAKDGVTPTDAAMSSGDESSQVLP
jgi:hypothetical protein